MSVTEILPEIFKINLFIIKCEHRINLSEDQRLADVHYGVINFLIHKAVMFLLSVQTKQEFLVSLAAMCIMALVLVKNSFGKKSFKNPLLLCALGKPLGTYFLRIYFRQVLCFIKLRKNFTT